MDIQNLLLLSKYIFTATIVFDLLVFILVFFQQKTNALQRYFLVMTGLLIIWEVALFGAFFITQSHGFNWISDFIAFAIGPFAAISILLFLNALANKNIIPRWTKIILFVIALLDIILVNVFMSQREMFGSLANEFTIPNNIYLYSYYLSYIPVTLVIIYVGIKLRKIAADSKLRQITLVLRGLLFAFFIATLACVWFPLLLDNYFMSRLTEANSTALTTLIEITGGIALSIFTTLSAFAISRYRLFDIHVVIQNKYIRAAITVLGFIAVFIVAYIVMLVTNSLAVFILIALVGTVLAQFGFNAFFQKFITQSAYDFSLPPELELLDDSQAALDQLFEHLQRDLRDEFGIEECVIYMYDRLDKQYRTMDSKPKLIPESHALVNLTNFKTEVVTRAQLEQSNNTITMSVRNELIHFFDKNGYSMALPLYNPVMNYGFVGITSVNESGVDFNNPFIREKLLHLGEKYGYYLGQILAYEAMVGASAKK